MADEKPMPKPTKAETAANLLRLGQLLHQFSYPLGDLGLTRPLKPDEAERLHGEIVALEKRVEEAVNDLRQWTLRSIFSVKGQGIVDILTVRIVAYVAWANLASERPEVSVARAANAVAMGDLATHLEARRIVRQMVAKGDATIRYKDSDFSGGELLPGSRLVKYLSGEGNLAVVWTEQSIQEEKDEFQKGRSGELPKKVQPSIHQAGPLAPAEASIEAPNLLTARGIYESLKDQVIGIDGPLRRFSAQMSLHMRRLEQIRKGVRPSVGPIVTLLIGSSGSSKTWMSECFAKASGLPYAVADMSGVSQASYVGLSVDECFYGLLANRTQPSEAQRGIVVLDEFDKICAKGSGGHSSVDAQGLGIQAEWLKPLEGCKLTLGGRRSNSPPMGVLDTYETCFILAGAFDGLRDQIQEGSRKSTGLGFGSAESRSPRSDIREALVKYGFMEQIINRISGGIIVLPDPTPEQLVSIITHQNGLLARWNSFANSFGMSINLKEEAIRYIAHWACETRGYSRAVKTMLGTLVEGHLIEDRKGDIQVSVADVKRAIEETEGTAGLKNESGG